MSFQQLVQNVQNSFKTGKFYKVCKRQFWISFNLGRTKSLEWRKQQLNAAIRMMEENEDQFLAALKSDLNKPSQEAFTSEIDMIKNDCIGYLRHIDQWTQTMLVHLSNFFSIQQAFLQKM